MVRSALHVCLISVHGLVRGHSPELGRDADTGGQVLYVIELARALAEHPDVAQVDLVTRLIDDPSVSDDYARPVETLAPNARILRIAAGGSAYIPKEQLWDHLDSFADNLLDHYRCSGAIPHLVHGHYADAGYVGTRVAGVLGVPLVHTGHSLGRVKRRRLLASGLDPATIEQRYAMSRRVAAEERTLAAAVRVITSTHQEIEEQYELYDFYRPSAMRVIPPGTDLSRFHPPRGDEHGTAIAAEVLRFLREPDKPMILALSRADARKNIATLVNAYGEDETLRERANLVLIIGNRDDLTELGDGARDVFTEILQLIDRHDLYGHVAYPKQHGSDEVPVLYRLATLSGGVFVNPALTEPFGLTLIEAAASGLPLVATEDGGPRDIVANCDNGILIDPLDPREIAHAIRTIINDWEGWQRRSATGLAKVREHYVWSAHAEEYLSMLRPLLEYDPATRERPPVMPVETGGRQYGVVAGRPPPGGARQPTYADRMLVSDLNRCLLGDEVALAKLRKEIRINRRRFLFGIISGLRLDAVLRLMRRHRIPEPDFIVTSTGTSITYLPKLVEDVAWTRRIERQWTPQVVRRVLADVPGLVPRERAQQSEFKIGYVHDPSLAPTAEEIAAMLFREEQAVNVFHSHGRFINVVPIRASKGLAMRYLASRWHVPLERVLAIGGSGADESMMRGNTLAALVGRGARKELAELAESERIYFADAPAAGGILEAMQWYDFLGSCRAPAAWSGGPRDAAGTRADALAGLAGTRRPASGGAAAGAPGDVGAEARTGVVDEGSGEGSDERARDAVPDGRDAGPAGGQDVKREDGVEERPIEALDEELAAESLSAEAAPAPVAEALLEDEDDAADVRPFDRRASVWSAGGESA